MNPISNSERGRKRAARAKDQLPQFFKERGDYVMIRTHAYFRDGSTAVRSAIDLRAGSVTGGEWGMMVPASDYSKRERAQNKARYWEQIKNKSIKKFDAIKARYVGVKEFFGDPQEIFSKLKRLQRTAQRAHAKWEKYDDIADSLAPANRKNSREAAKDRVKRETERFRKRLDAIEV